MPLKTERQQKAEEEAERGAVSQGAVRIKDRTGLEDFKSPTPRTPMEEFLHSQVLMKSRYEDQIESLQYQIKMQQDELLGLYRRLHVTA